jgi:hypothetical protein
MTKIVRIGGDTVTVAEAVQDGGPQCEACGSWQQVPREGYRGWWTTEQEDTSTGAITHWVQRGYRYRKTHEPRGYIYCAGCGARYQIEEVAW